MAASYSIATPPGQSSLQNQIVQLTAYLDSGHTIIDTNARIYWQRYAQSSLGIFDIAQRSNLAGRIAGCINICYFDPDKVATRLYHSPKECIPVTTPIQRTDVDLQLAYEDGDFSILIEGYDAVSDLGFEIKSLYHNDGTPLLFNEFVPGSIYVDPQLGMFMFFHHPDSWDACSHWEFAWWDSSDYALMLSMYGIDITAPPYVTDWSALVNIPSSVPSYAPRNGGDPLPQPWDGQTSPGFAQPSWSDVTNPLPLNTYWSVVSEAPTETANVIVSYWTQDNTDPLEPRGGGTADEAAWKHRNELYTSPITMATDTQIRFRSVNVSSEIEDTRVETYIVGMRFDLTQGINLISQPYETSSPDNDLDMLCSGLNLLQIFRIEEGLWQVYSQSLPVRDFTTIDNQHGLFFIMNESGSFCFPYGTAPTTTELSLVDKDTNQGINAIAVPRSSSVDNSIDNLLLSRQIEFDEIQRVTNNIFETYIPGRSPVLNFNPADLTPGRGYGIVAPKTQVFELPFVD